MRSTFDVATPDRCHTIHQESSRSYSQLQHSVFRSSRRCCRFRRFGHEPAPYVNLVGRDMEKAKRFAILLCQCHPICPCFLEQTECSIHIGADKVIGTSDGAIYVAFCSKMDYSSGPMAFQNAMHQIAITDVAVHEAISRIRGNTIQIARVASISQLIK